MKEILNIRKERILSFIILAAVIFTMTGITATAEDTVRDSGSLLGDWTNYNSIIFGDAVIHNSTSGGGLAVKGSITVNNDFTIGSTYSSVYDATRHIGEYKNEGNYPAFLYGGNNIEISPRVRNLNVLGGDIVMNDTMMLNNDSLNPGFTADSSTSGYKNMPQGDLNNWFDRQYEIVKAASDLFSQANDTEINMSEFAESRYMNAGPLRFENKYMTVGGDVYENALFITVRTKSDVDFGTWWPDYSVIHVALEWAKQYDLVVYSFPDAINVTMNSSSFFIEGMNHWSTTVDAWVGAVGMEERLALAEKVVYNFPNAENIRAHHALIQGSILAPEAVFTGIGAANSGDGHLYGHLIAKELIVERNFTIHAFSLTHAIYEIPEESIKEEVLTGSVDLQQFLYFDGKTAIPADGGEFILIETQNGGELYFDGNGGFTSEQNSAHIYTAPVVINDIPLGNYTLRQISSPDDFVLNTSNSLNSYTYYEYDISLTEPDVTVRANRYVAPDTRDVHIIKTDTDSGQGLEGAKFVLIREADQYSDTISLGEYTSGADGKFMLTGLPVGTYHLVEVEIPDGHELAGDGDFQFTIYSENGLKIMDSGNTELEGDLQNPIRINNDAGIPENSIVVMKYAVNPNGNGQYSLSGAEFELYKKNNANTWDKVLFNANNEAIEIITNASGYYRIKNLEAGTYRLVETKAPTGYGVQNQIIDGDFPDGYAYEAVIGNNLSDDFYTAYIPNRALETEITVKNVGKILDDIVPLSGAKFMLEYRRGNRGAWEESINPVYTDANGEITFTGLTYGSYRLTQLTPPAGYSPIGPANIYFTIWFDETNVPDIEVTYNGLEAGTDTPVVWVSSGRDFTITIENEQRIRDFLVYKTSDVDKDGKPSSADTLRYLEGAVFRLQRRAAINSPWIDYGDEFTTSYLYENGTEVKDLYGNHVAAASFDRGLLIGYYRLIEVQTPHGFTTGSNIEVYLNDGTKGYEANRFVITERMVEFGGTTAFTVMNYAKRAELTVTYMDSTGSVIAEEARHYVVEGLEIDVADYIVNIDNFKAVYYEANNIRYDLDDPLDFNQDTTVNIYYASTVMNLTFPYNIEFHANLTNAGEVVSQNYKIINNSELPAVISFKELKTEGKDLDGLNFTSNALNNWDIHLNLNLPEFSEPNGFTSSVTNIPPNRELNKVLGVLGGMLAGENGKDGIFTVGGKYIGPFMYPFKNPQVSFIFSFEAAG